MVSEKSTPTTGSAPRSAALAATYPGPVATSSSRVPGPAPTASRSGSATFAVTRPARASYAAASFVPHPAASKASKAAESNSLMT